MSVTVNLMLAYASQGIPLGCLVLLLLAFARRLGRRYGARWLCRLWLALAVLLLLPLRFAMPGTAAAKVAVPAAWAQAGTLHTAEAPAMAQAEPVSPAVSGAGAASPGAAEEPAPGLPQAASPLGLLAAAWLGGTAVVLLWQGAAWFAWRRRAAGSASEAGPDWQQALDDAQAAVPLRRRPRLLASNAVRGPVTAGVLRPVLLVPGAAPAPAGASLMLLHELTHLQRRDLQFKLLLTVACALHWYNPAVWLLARRAGKDIEAACDEQVTAGRDFAFRAAYSDALLRAARMGRSAVLATGFALSRRDWAERLRQLWAPAPKRRGRCMLAGLALAGLAAGSLVACRTAEPGSAAPAPSPAPTAQPETALTPEPEPSLAGRQEVWPGLVGWPSSLSADPPAALAGLAYWQMDDYTVPDIGRTGYAVAEPGGVALYTTLDGGADWQEQHADLTPALGQEPFAITNYQMVSDSTGFLVVRLGTDGDAALGDGSLRYWTDDDCAVLRTTDGGATWQLAGRHSLPADTEQGAWHLQPFLWLNENVGFWAPHTSNTHFCLWRTVDGGATWQALDLAGLEAQLPAGRPGIHTCSLWLDPGTPGGVWVHCALQAGSSLENDFALVTDDYGETWRLADWQPQAVPAAAPAPNGGETQ